MQTGAVTVSVGNLSLWGHIHFQVTDYSSVLILKDRGFRLESSLVLIFFPFFIENFAKKEGTSDILLCGAGAG